MLNEIRHRKKTTISSHSLVELKKKKPIESKIIVTQGKVGKGHGER